LPKLAGCRVDACDRKETEQRQVPVREDAKGEPVQSLLDGASRSVMYECDESSSPTKLVQAAFEALRPAGFNVLYQYAGLEGTLTARKDDLVLIVEAASHYYTLTEFTVAPPNLEAIEDADALADALDRYHHAPLYKIRFAPGRADFIEGSIFSMQAVADMLEDHPNWHIRVEAHTDNTGTKPANVLLSTRRATAVTNYLVSHGVDKSRVEPVGLGDAQPVATNSTADGRAKNQRIEIVKIEGAQ
jgi:outer membrane protein OmpA-like peptidoglycan-associated protein